MNKKISLGIAISLVAIGCAITFVLTWTVSLNIYNSKLGTSEKYEGVYAKLREIDTTVRQNYIGSVSDDSLENATINGYISGIGDKYASYIAPSAYYELQQTQSGVILGAGFEAEEDTSGYLKITTVYKGSSAELNGVLSGDIITAIDGKEMNKMADLQEYLAKKRPGDKVSVSYLRDKKKASKTMTLKNEQGNTQVVKKADLDVLGGNFRAITDGQKKQLNIGYGLEVLKVNSGKFKDAGITKGFIIQRVNDSAVKTIEDLQNLVKEASTSRNPVLYIQGVYPTGKKAYFAVPLED